MLSKMGLKESLNLNKLDCLSFIVAAVCHDLGHDGFNNSYHVNAMTKRAIDSNDISVQETFHSSEVFRILSDDNCNFTEKFTKEEFRIFRKRVIGCILATDMAKHVADCAHLKGLLADHDIKDGQNLNKLTDGADDSQLFQNQQFILEISLHACDVSQQGRDFPIVHEWTYLLFDEFFDQGDLER
jgi:hypothetical protein